MPKQKTRPDNEYAYGAVRNAIKNGEIRRPNRCQKCRKVGKAASDGRATIHAHHDDYSKPLSVKWLCAQCHKTITPLPIKIGAPVFGEKNGQSKLNNNKVKYIRSSKKSTRELGCMFGVHPKTVLRARNKKHWREVS